MNSNEPMSQESIQPEASQKRSKKIFIIVGIIIVLAVVIGIGFKNKTTIRYEDKDFSIVLSKGWEKTEPKTPIAELRALFANRQSGASFTPRVIVSSGKEIGTTTLDIYAPLKEKDIKTRFTFIATSSVHVGATNLFLITYSFDNDGKKIVNTDAVAVKNNIIYTVSGVAEQSFYTAHAQEIETILKSFRLK
jgi:hypothetical protein